MLRASASSHSSLRSVPQRQKQSEDEWGGLHEAPRTLQQHQSVSGKPRVHTLGRELLHGRHVSQSLQRFVCVHVGRGGAADTENYNFFFLIQRQKKLTECFQTLVSPTLRRHKSKICLTVLSSNHNTTQLGSSSSHKQCSHYA